MANQTWRICLDSEIHEIKVQHGWWSAERQIFVDGVRIIHEPPSWKTDYGSEHSFPIGEHTCILQIKTNGLTFFFILEIDGQPVENFIAPSDYLLRAAEYPAVGGDVLLRPAAADPDTTSPQELLRASDKTEADAA